MTQTPTPVHPLQHIHTQDGTCNFRCNEVSCFGRTERRIKINSRKERGKREKWRHCDLILEKARSEANSVSLRWSGGIESSIEKWMPSTLITTNNVGLVAFGSLSMERWEAKCRTTKIQRQLNARSFVTSLALPDTEHPAHRPPQRTHNKNIQLDMQRSVLVAS